MKTIIWKGQPAFIPKVGQVKKGQQLTVKDGLAQSYIEQGLADEFRDKPKREKS